MQLNGIPLSQRSAMLLYLPVDHLMSGTLLACEPERVPPEYRDEYQGIYDGWAEGGRRYREWMKSSAVSGLFVKTFRDNVYNFDAT